MAKIRRMQGFNPNAMGYDGKQKVGPEDYIYALEVAGQKAVTPQEKKMQEDAKNSVKYLEAKYPGIAGKFKLFGDRVQNNEASKTSNKKSDKKNKLGGSH
jgi:hypothetical protein